jgi:hypothetical protein
MTSINPLSKGAVVGDPSLAAVAANTVAFQKCLDEQATTSAPIEIPGKFYVGPLVPSTAVHLAGENWRYSSLVFDARDQNGVDKSAALFDFNAKLANPFGSIIERVRFESKAGQQAAQAHTGFQFRRSSKGNRNVLFSGVYAAGWSDAFIEIAQTWNCRVEDCYGLDCGRPAAQNSGKEGAFLRIGGSTDDMTSSGNVYSNLFLTGCHHGITATTEGVLLFQEFEQIFSEYNNVGIYAPNCRDSTLSHCYFEANFEHGAVMGHARVESCRHRPGTADDIVLNPDMTPWQAGVSQNEYFVSERLLTVANNEIMELWAPAFGLVSFAPSNTDYGPLGIARVRTTGTPKIKALVGLNTHPVWLDVQPPDLSLWPGKFAILAIDGELWVQNRTGFTVDFTYHVIGPPWSDA